MEREEEIVGESRGESWREKRRELVREEKRVGERSEEGMWYIDNYQI